MSEMGAASKETVSVLEDKLAKLEETDGTSKLMASFVKKLESKIMLRSTIAKDQYTQFHAQLRD